MPRLFAPTPAGGGVPIWRRLCVPLVHDAEDTTGVEVARRRLDDAHKALRTGQAKDQHRWNLGTNAAKRQKRVATNLQRAGAPQLTTTDIDQVIARARAESSPHAADARPAARAGSSSFVVASRRRERIRRGGHATQASQRRLDKKRRTFDVERVHGTMEARRARLFVIALVRKTRRPSFERGIVSKHARQASIVSFRLYAEPQKTPFAGSPC